MDVIDVEHRLNMVKLAVSDNPFFDISDIECRRPGVSYTVDTLNILIREYSLSSPLFVLGTDAFLELPLWHKPEDVVKLTDFVVVTRPHYDVSELLGSPFVKKKRPLYENAGISVFELITGKRAIVLRCTNLDISASFIRESIRNGRSIRYLVPESVISYITEHNLYRG